MPSTKKHFTDTEWAGQEIHFDFSRKTTQKNVESEAYFLVEKLIFSNPP